MEAAIKHARLEGKHRFLGILPLFHSTGLLATLLAPMMLGSLTVYIARFSPVATLNAIREHQISIMVAVPSMYAAIVRLKDARPEDFKNMYAAISGGEPLPAAVREAFKQKFGADLRRLRIDRDHRPDRVQCARERFKPGSVGRLIPGAEVQDHR